MGGEVDNSLIKWMGLLVVVGREGGGEGLVFKVLLYKSQVKSLMNT